MNPARFRWGVLFILVGSLLLVENIWDLTEQQWLDILSLWPALLIIIGLEKIFAHTRLKFIAYLTSVALAALVVYVAIAGLPFESNSYRTTDRYSVDHDPEIEQLQVRIYTKDTDLTIDDRPGLLFYATSRGSGRKPSFSYRASGETGYVRMDTDSRFGFTIRRNDRHGRDRIYLTPEIPVQIYCQADDADLQIDGSRLRLSKVAADNEDGRTEIKVGRLNDSLEIELGGDDNDILLYLPTGVGVSVSQAGPDLSDYLDRYNFERAGEYLRSAGYDTTRTRIAIDVRDDIARFSIIWRDEPDSI